MEGLRRRLSFSAQMLPKVSFLSLYFEHGPLVTKHTKRCIRVIFRKPQQTTFVFSN